MTPFAAARDRARSPAGAGRVVLSCDETGCTLSGGSAERRFTDVRKALDCARQSRETEAATIEVWRDGQYICCVAPRSQHYGDGDSLGIHPPSIVPNSWLDAAERYANRAARALMATAGPLFWMALIFFVVAASLGAHLLLL